MCDNTVENKNLQFQFQFHKTDKISMLGDFFPIQKYLTETVNQMICSYTNSTWLKRNLQTRNFEMVPIPHLTQTMKLALNENMRLILTWLTQNLFNTILYQNQN